MVWEMHLGNLVGEDGANAAVKIVDVNLEVSAGIVLAKVLEGFSESSNCSSFAALKRPAVHLHQETRYVS